MHANSREYSRTRVFTEKDDWPYSAKHVHTVHKTSNDSRSSMTGHRYTNAIDFDRINSTVLNATSESQASVYSLKNYEINHSVTGSSLDSSTTSRASEQPLETWLSSHSGKKSERGDKKDKGKCSRHRLAIDTTDLGWNEWIFLPSRFEIGYCGGSCKLQRKKVNCPHTSCPHKMNHVVL